MSIPWDCVILLCGVRNQKASTAAKHTTPMTTIIKAGGFKGARRAPLVSDAALAASQPPAGSCTERAAHHNVKRREMYGIRNAHYGSIILGVVLDRHIYCGDHVGKVILELRTRCVQRSASAGALNSLAQRLLKRVPRERAPTRGGVWWPQLSETQKSRLWTLQQ